MALLLGWVPGQFIKQRFPVPIPGNMDGAGMAPGMMPDDGPAMLCCSMLGWFMP